MKTWRFVGVSVMAILFAALLLAAAPPITVTNPDSAPYLDGDYHTIPANTTLWYRLNYAGDHSQLVVLLNKGNENALQFMVHKPDQMTKWWTDPSPVGRGTAKQDDLIWAGNSHEPGTWYVELTNPNATAQTYRFTVQGKGFLPENPAVTTAAAAVAPATTTQPTFENTDPTKAIAIADQQYVIPANTTLWYSFYYPGDNSQITVRLPRGVDENLRYAIITPEQVDSWWNADPIGRGNPYDNGLIWSSKSHVPGTYYVKVTNDNPYAVAFNLSTK